MQREKPTLPSQLIASLYAYRAMPSGIRARCQLQRPNIDAIVNWNGGLRSERDNPVKIHKRNALALLRLCRSNYLHLSVRERTDRGGFASIFAMQYPDTDRGRSHMFARWQRRYLRGTRT